MPCKSCCVLDLCCGGPFACYVVTYLVVESENEITVTGLVGFDSHNAEHIIKKLPSLFCL